MTDHRARLLTLLAAILAAAALRLVPHPPNFTPVGAMALFSGAMLGRRWLAFAAPVGAMLVSDLVLGFHGTILVVYAAMALVVTIGWALRGRVSALGVAGGAIASSVLFFLITNLAVWLQGGMYPMTPGGLAACYLAAIPFFQNTLAGDLFYAAVLFGGFALLERMVPTLREPALRTA